MTLKLKFPQKQMPIYIFMVFYCYLFVFQYIINSFIDEVCIIITLPLLALTLAKREVFSIKKYMIPVILMFLLILAWSTEPHQSFIYYFIMVEAIFFIRPEVSDIRLIINMIKRTALVNAFFVLLSRIFPDLMSAYARLVFSYSAATGYVEAMKKGYYSGLNNQVSFTAAYLALGIFAYFFDKRGNKQARIMKLAFLCLALILTNKRAHLVYLAASLLSVYYICGNKNKKLDRGIKIAFISSVLLGLMFLIASLFPTLPVLSRLISIVSIFTDNADANVVLSGRVSIYRQVINLFMSNKAFGIGWQNFADFSVARSVTGGVNQGHNVFLQLLCETGIVGFILFLLINLYYLHYNLHTSSLYIKKRSFFIDNGDLRTLDVGIKCAVAFMVFYYLFWFSGNAFYDPTYIYTWTIAILLSQSISKVLTK